MSNPSDFARDASDCPLTAAGPQLYNEFRATARVLPAANASETNSVDKSLSPLVIVDATAAPARKLCWQDAYTSGHRPQPEPHRQIEPGSRDLQEAARLEKILRSHGLVEKLDSAKTGKLDGKISKHDLEIYLRMHRENNEETRAVRTILEAWNDRHHPCHHAVQILKEQLKHEYHGKGANFPTMQKLQGQDIMPSLVPRPMGSSCFPEKSTPAQRVPQVESKNTPATIDRVTPLSPELKAAGQVRAGEGYYQVGQRMLETIGQKPSPQETLALAKALRTANNDRTVLTTQDNLADLLIKKIPGARSSIFEQFSEKANK